MSDGSDDLDPDVRALLAELTEAVNDQTAALREVNDRLDRHEALIEDLHEQMVTREEVVEVTAEVVADEFEGATREGVEAALTEALGPAERPEPDGKMFQ